jgi:CheY-like chemotaxis protein
VAATVLVVDDHPSFRRFARRLLEAAGFTVVDEAGDGAAALAAVRTLRPDVVLLDVLLPDTTGTELAEVLASEPAAPLVVLTSSRSAADLEPSLARSSARGFIAKRDLTVASFAALVGGAA